MIVSLLYFYIYNICIYKACSIHVTFSRLFIPPVLSYYCTIQITNADTYLYDIQINTADGRVDTIVGPAKFKVIGGITY